MANFEVLSLDPTTPQIRAPGAGDGYSVPRDMTFATGTTLNAPTTVVSVDTATDALRITQVGSGNALLVEDSANPDATPTVITATGNVGIGTTSPATNLSIIGTGIPDAGSVGAYQVSVDNNAAYNANPQGGIIHRFKWSSAGTLTTGAGIRFYKPNTNDSDASSQIGFIVRSGISAQSQAMTLDSSGNLGLGVTPSAWASTHKAIQMNWSAFSTDAGNGETSVSTNAFASAASTWNYRSTAPAARYTQDYFGKHLWYTAASGTAGNAITFTQAMTLDASGNLGIGTTSPGARLHVAGGVGLIIPSGGSANSPESGAGTWSVYGANSGPTDRTGALRVECYSDQDANVGTGIAFSNRYITSNVASWTMAKIGAYKDNNASGGAGGYLTFSTTSSGGPLAERARITSTGELLVGTTSTSPSASAGAKIYPGGTMRCVNADSANTSENWSMYSTGAANYRFYVGWGGTVYATNTTISAISDQRYKENIRDLDVGLDAILALKPRKFDWKAGQGKDIKDDRGFIAQEFEQVFPDLVDEWKDPAPEGEEPYKSVRQDLIPVLVKAMQEQQAMIEELKAKVAQLEAR